MGTKMRTELPKSLYLPGDLCRLVLASSIFQGGLEAGPWGVFRSGWSKGKGVGGPKRVGTYMGLSSQGLLTHKAVDGSGAGRFHRSPLVVQPSCSKMWDEKLHREACMKPTSCGKADAGLTLPHH